MGRKDTAGRVALAVAGIGAYVAVRAGLRAARRVAMAGRVVLVTGGSRGLGLALAEEFARRGAKVALCARDERELDAAGDTLRQITEDVLTMPCDVSDEAQVRKLLDAILARYGALDVVVNNAGIIMAGPWDTQTEADYREAMDVMFWGPWRVTMQAIPHLRGRQGARVVTITSIGGKVAIPHLLSYSSAKFAATGFSEGLHAELAGEGIRVVTVAPGLMRTGSAVNAIFKGRNQEEYSLFTPLDSNPVSSISAARAARQIVNATERGDAELVVSIQAQALAAFHGLFPGTTASLLGLAARVLPKNGGIGQARATGRESETAITRSPLGAMEHAAAERYNAHSGVQPDREAHGPGPAAKDASIAAQHDDDDEAATATTRGTAIP